MDTECINELIIKLVNRNSSNTIPKIVETDKRRIDNT